MRLCRRIYPPFIFTVQLVSGFCSVPQVGMGQVPFVSQVMFKVQPPAGHPSVQFAWSAQSKAQVLP